MIRRFSFVSPMKAPAPPRLLALILPLLISSAASAAVKHAGTWPEAAAEKPVTLDMHAAGRGAALNDLADAAGWSLITHDLPETKTTVNLHVKQQSPSDLLDLLLSDGDYVATRTGNLVSLAVAPAAAPDAAAYVPIAAVIPATPPLPAVASASAEPPAPPAPLAAPARHGGRGEDRTVTGGALRIDANETVHDVAVLGGALDVFGEVTGDVSVLGGSVHLHKGAHVDGSADVIGGRLQVDDGAEVNGDVGVIGGNVVREPGSKIHGSVTGSGDDDHSSASGDDDDDDDDAKGHAHDGDSAAAKAAREGHDRESHPEVRSFFGRVFDRIGHAISSASLLFVLGAILIALAPRRMDKLRAELAARPMRSFAIGIVSILAGAILLGVLCITILGIPLAILLACAAPIAMFCGVCAIVTTLGGMLMQHRTENPYAHLALGCAIFMVAGFIPLVGDVVHAVLGFAGFGVMVITRAAGLLPTSKRSEV